MHKHHSFGHNLYSAIHNSRTLPIAGIRLNSVLGDSRSGSAVSLSLLHMDLRPKTTVYLAACISLANHPQHTAGKSQH